MSYEFPKMINETHNIRSYIDELALFVFIPNDSNLDHLDQSIDYFVKLRSQSFTSLIADLHYINRV